MFAKLFETDLGQLLIVRDRDDKTSQPEVRLHMQPPELGICSIRNRYPDNQSGEAAADEFFQSIDQPTATAWARQLLNSIP